MINKAVVSVLLGLSTKAFLEFYRRYKEVDDFGRLTLQEAFDLARSEKGTLAQQERLLQLTLMQLHARADAHNLNTAFQKAQEWNQKETGFTPNEHGQYL